MTESATETRTGEPFILEEFMPFKLAVLSDAVSKLIARDYSDRFGITIAEWRVMALVSQYDEVRAQTVVDKTPMDKVAVSRAVASLVEKGLLEKRTSETDRRSALLHLSEKGSDIANEIQAVAKSHNDDVLQALNKTELAALQGLLDKLIVQAKNLTR
ncbi:winged helix-turn-helix transcriptional regulator [Parvularcula flava]|uniref:MarR family transcriptional regulator n=1 Tax=Aquisalinus luteolus TaxID=1566827 RepID=A0A8J3A1D5_9PROT|nr:MarR family winged helix-turn-helix transcriptional regulator [Aquisalinus luteolus]NHK27545.1 winged helix-turn-helix transcriptional regulator [Aquisalinus luteolus]GGH95760.1 MarR family transcriptional regulator [Aquisalinus luteolus]